VVERSSLDTAYLRQQIGGLSSGLMIAEHWDTLEAIPPRDQWKNSNGKF
jgi:hypothetical protein